MSRHITTHQLANRYRQARVCQHLAGQYIAGLMTTRVRSRMEALLPHSPELNEALASWSDTLADINDQLPLKQQPSAELWQRIETQINQGSVSAQQPQQTISGVPTALTSWWKSILLWQAMTLTSTMAAIVLALILLFPAGPQEALQRPLAVQSASYIAPMSQREATRIDVVISAYKGPRPGTSQLHIQWSKHASSTALPDELHLWAEDRDTHQLTYLGVTNNAKKHWTLSKPKWQAVANSVQLLATSTREPPQESTIVFTGPCIQLKPWKTQPKTT